MQVQLILTLDFIACSALFRISRPKWDYDSIEVLRGFLKYFGKLVSRLRVIFMSSGLKELKSQKRQQTREHTSKWSTFFVHMVFSRLDAAILRNWEVVVIIVVIFLANSLHKWFTKQLFSLQRFDLDLSLSLYPVSNNYLSPDEDPNRDQNVGANHLFRPLARKIITITNPVENNYILGSI